MRDSHKKHQKTPPSQITAEHLESIAAAIIMQTEYLREGRALCAPARLSFWGQRQALSFQQNNQNGFLFIYLLSPGRSINSVERSSHQHIGQRLFA